MKLKKIDKIDEVVDGNNNLIGYSDDPEKGGDLESQAKNSTDYNAKISRQPYRYDMLGRFGFTLFPFFEGKEDDEQNALLNDLLDLLFRERVKTLKHYYKNPNKLKNDYRKLSKDEFKVPTEEIDTELQETTKEILKVIEPHIEKSLEGLQRNLDENVVIEDKVVGEKNTKWIDEKDKDKEVLDKDIKKVVGFLNRLDREDLNKVINLLEV